MALADNFFLARAITITPKVFLMDEPLGDLDPPSRAHVMSEIKDSSGIENHNDLCSSKSGWRTVDSG